ncbi:MAG: hypothetical protein NC397_09010 [Clostridium sp.]|nr:hypothetical protein [Clostridium sp.]
MNIKIDFKGVDGVRTKYEIPKDIYQSVIWFIRGQQRREREYNDKLSDIMDGGGAKYISFVNEKTKKTERAYLPSGKGENKSATEIKGLALEALNNSKDAKNMKSVQQALRSIGSDIESEELRNQLQQALMLNIKDRKNFPYCKLCIPGICKRQFYEYKAEFIYTVAKNNCFL